MTRVAVATCSGIAAEAAGEVASGNGNAVDCALAAAIVACNTEPGVCALAGGAYISIWRPGQAPVTIDGNVAAPGAGLESIPGDPGVESVRMDYGGGITTLVGAGTVGVPGTLAAMEIASREYGRAPWRELFAPAVRLARDGFPLSRACHYYLCYSGKPVFGRSRDGYNALHEGDRLRDAGELIKVPHLATSLERIAEQGASDFYNGELAAAISGHCRAGSGKLTARDLADYQAIVRPALKLDLGAWTIATTPPPAIGGAMLGAMLLASGHSRASSPDREFLGSLIDIQRACLSYRRERLDLADDVGAAVEELLAKASDASFLRRRPSAATVHTSAVDDTGLACAITASAGYGSGEMPEGTGLWLNNSLGELELNRRGLDAGPPGTRLPSNMAPTVARCGDTVLAAGSPGADRITTALQQFLLYLTRFGMSLEEAIARPRIHVDLGNSEPVLMAEPGLPMPDTDLPVRVSPELNMYFGGVAAASYAPKRGFHAAADPRREGGTLKA